MLLLLASGHHRFDVQEAAPAYVEAFSAETLSCRLREPLAFELAQYQSLRLQPKHSDMWRLLLRLNKHTNNCKATVSSGGGVLGGAVLSCCCCLL